MPRQNPEVIDMLRRVLPFALLLSPLAGCIIIEIPSDLSFESDADADAAWADEGTWATTGGSGRVRGDIGMVRDFDARTENVQASSDSSWSSVTVTAYDSDARMGMLIVELDGDVRSLASGTYRYTSAGVDGPSLVSGLYVTGCSGDGDDSYDAPSAEGVIIVDNDGDDCVVDVAAQLPSDDTSVTTTAMVTFTLE